MTTACKHDTQEFQKSILPLQIQKARNKTSEIQDIADISKS